MKNAKLRELILGLNGTIVIEEYKPKKVMKAINKLLNVNTVEITILRDTFATGTELEPYTDREWEVIYAMYSTTYGWDNTFELLTGNNPKEVQEEYFKDRETPTSKKLHKLKGLKDTELSKYNVVGTEYYSVLCKEILSSKQALSKHHKDILDLLPISVLKEVYLLGNITFKETEVLVIKRLLVELDSDQLDGVLSSPNQIVRVVVSSYSKYTNDTLSELSIDKIVSRVNKNVFKKLGLKVKIPNPIKRKILSSLETMSSKRNYVEFKKYRTFWKTLFKQLMIKNRKYMVNKYPVSMAILNRLYSNDNIPTLNTVIEEVWLSGDLEETVKLESNNLGKLIGEKLLAYLRYSVGDTLARKVKETEVMSNVLDLKEVDFSNGADRAVVKTDASKYLQSKEFYNKLVESGNTKLLIKAQGLLRDARVYEYMITRKVNGVDVEYEKPGLPPVRKDVAKILLENLNLAISEIMREVNKDKGKVYIDSSVQGIGVPASERDNNSIAISGITIPKGSKIKLDLEKYENPVIRIALLWSTDSSDDWDLDLGVNIVGKQFGEKHCYFGTGQLIKEGNVLASTSGDWTDTPSTGFATEFIDIDINYCKKYGVEQIISSALTYSTGNRLPITVYLGIDICDRVDRAMTTNARTQLDLADFYYMVKTPYERMDNVLGHMINLVTGELEVYNENVGKFTSSTAEQVYELMVDTLSKRPMAPMLSDILPTVFTKKQLVSTPNEADIIISTATHYSTIGNDKIEVINPLKDPLKLQEYLYN